MHMYKPSIESLPLERGFTQEQAEGVMETVQEVAISGVATKEDIHDLEIGLRTEI